MMGWFKISVDKNTYAAFLMFGNSVTDGPQYILVTSNDGVTLIIYNGSVTAAGSTLTVGTWTHLAMTVAGTGAGQCLGYVNGVLNITTAGNSAIPAQMIAVCTDIPNEFNNGCAANIQVYDAVLTATEIQREMQAYLPHRTANLVVWSPLMTVTDVTNYVVAGSAAWTVAGTLVTEPGPPIPWSLGPRIEVLQVAPVAPTLPQRSFAIPSQAVANALL
jgi:hypothetical protein